MKKMRFNNTEDDDKDDLFDGYDPEEEVKKPKEPVYHPDDPRYWDRDEGEWDHLRPRGRKRWLMRGALVLGALIILWLGWRLIFAPYTDDVVQYGYVETVERRGNVFKTYEGVLLPYKELHDTTRAYTEDFTFSASEKIGHTLRELQNSGRPLRVEYAVYRFPLPWRGENKRVIVRVDTVSPDSILPLPYRPAIPPAPDGQNR